MGTSEGTDRTEGEAKSAASARRSGPDHDERLGKWTWHRSPWLIPVVAIAGLVLADQIGGATSVVGATAVAAALSVALIFVPSLNSPATRVALVVGLLGAVAVVLVALDHPSVDKVIEATTTSSARAHRASPEKPYSLRGAVVRADQVKARDLRGIDLTSADLDGLDLRTRILDDAHLQGASLAGADLRGAYLRGAHLEGARLRGARLDGACLLGAHLDGADLSGATAKGADVTGVTGANEARNEAAAWPRTGANAGVCG